MSDVAKLNVSGVDLNIKDSSARASITSILSTIGNWTDVDDMTTVIANMDMAITNNAGDITTINNTLANIPILNKKQADALREYLAGEITLNVTCIGDSLTYGSSPADTSVQVTNNYPYVLSNFLNEYGAASVTNLGVSGDTSSDVLARIGTVPTSSDLCIVMVGTNDINQDVDPSDYITNVIGIIDSLLEDDVIPVIVSPPPLLRPDEKRRAKHGVYNNLLKITAAMYGLTYVPCYDILSKFINDSSLNAGTIDDGTHFTNYTTIAGAVFETILPGCITVLEPEGFTQMIRNKGVVTDAGIVGTSNTGLSSYGNLMITQASSYKCLVKVPKYSQLWIVGDGIARGGELAFTFGSSSYTANVNNALATEASCRAFFATVPGGYYMMKVTGVNQGSSTEASDWRFYFNGIYVTRYSRSNKNISINAAANEIITRNYMQSFTITAGSTPDLDFAVDAIPGYSIIGGLVMYMSSSGICVSYIQTLSATSMRVKAFSARSSDVTANVQLKVFYVLTH